MDRETRHGCLMCDSIYVKANGDLPCWDDVGESKVLRRLSFPGLLAGAETNLFNYQQLIDIRRAFMSGRTPYPGLCELCAVRDHGPLVASMAPDTIRILHIEPSYFCHLSCPQCIPSKDRKNRASPPYNMPASAVDALLRQLKAEGISSIQTVHFEGRGDPLMNAELGRMIQTTRQHYEDAITMVTTHGSYPYKPWIVDCGLNILRVSIDGAFPDNYAKYRVGGNLSVALKFLESVRNDRERLHSSIQVIWKYILFEWNDSDEEMQHAAALAKELNTSLQFVVTHTPGRSKRFPDPLALRKALEVLAPEAQVETTFPLKPSAAELAESELNRRIQELLGLAKALIAARNEVLAIHAILHALAYECGVLLESDWGGRSAVRAYIPLLLKVARRPATLAELSEIFCGWGEPETSILLLKKYLKIVKDMPRLERLWLALRLKLQLRSRIRDARGAIARSMSVG